MNKAASTTDRPAYRVCFHLFSGGCQTITWTDRGIMEDLSVCRVIQTLDDLQKDVFFQIFFFQTLTVLVSCLAENSRSSVPAPMCSRSTPPPRGTGYLLASTPSRCLSSMMPTATCTASSVWVELKWVHKVNTEGSNVQKQPKRVSGGRTSMQQKICIWSIFPSGI